MVGSSGASEKALSMCPLNGPREEKTEQLVDTRHEVDQLVLELQKVKQEVSRSPFCRVWRGRAGLPQ